MKSTPTTRATMHVKEFSGELEPLFIHYACRLPCFLRSVTRFTLCSLYTLSVFERCSIYLFLFAPLQLTSCILLGRAAYRVESLVP